MSRAQVHKENIISCTELLFYCSLMLLGQIGRFIYKLFYLHVFIESATNVTEKWSEQVYSNANYRKKKMESSGQTYF
jgi:hypothetical protein